MLKVAKDDVRDGEQEYNNAVILGEELKLGKNNDGNCFCKRALKTEEVKEIIEQLRDSEKDLKGNYKLFQKKNCKLPESDKTIGKFTVELNKIFLKYKINTCIRRIHFLAQIYHETDRLRTTKEYESKHWEKYKPYVGRGLMQLTWKSGYARYKAYSGFDCVTNYEKIAEKLHYAFDSAGWFWKRGKELNKGTTWKVPKTSFSEYDSSTGKTYPKTNYAYTLNGKTSRYGTIDMNLLADEGFIDTISWLVNGGGNGRQERRDYLKL